MVTVEEAFDVWLNGNMYGETTRREFAAQQGMRIGDLYWAFVAGRFEGKQSEW